MGEHLSSAQKALVKAMIESAGEFGGNPVSDAQRRKWAAHLDGLGYAGSACDCGHCPSFRMRAAAEGDDSAMVVLSAESSLQAMVLLFIDGGVPRELEIAPWGDQAVGLPDPATLSFS